MPNRNIVLTEHDFEVIDRLVKSGRYQNAGEVLGEGLRLVEQQEEVETLELEFLRLLHSLRPKHIRDEEIDPQQFLRELQAERRSGRG